MRFALEEWQSRYEDAVRFNLADSGVHPVRLDELLRDDPDQLAALHRMPLGYPPVGGSDRLRALVAALHPGARPEQVLVTVGGSEANAVALRALVRRGDRAVVLEPGYRQAWGTLQNLGLRVDAVHLREDRGWRPDLDEVTAAVRPGTRVVCVANPCNPTGTVLTREELAAVVEACERAGAWLLVDEVHRGTERTAEAENPTAFGASGRVVVTGSLSKAYGLHGLRVGWLVAPAALVESAWRRHEYLTIATAALSMRLAEVALAEAARARLLSRGRAHVRDGWERVRAWLDGSGGLVHAHPPDATAVSLVRYDLDLLPRRVAEELRDRAGVLVAPGDAFGLERHLRIGHGVPAEVLEPALRRAGEVLATLRG